MKGLAAGKAANFAGRPATQWHCVEIYNSEEVWLGWVCSQMQETTCWTTLAKLSCVLGLELSHNHSLTELFSEWICVTDWLLVAVSQPFDLTAVAALNWTGAKPRQPPCQLQHMSIKLRTCSYKWTAHWLQTLHQFGHWLNILRETRQH